MRLLTPPILLCSMAVGTATAQQPVWLDHFGNESAGNTPFYLTSADDASIYAFGAFAGPPMVVGNDTLDQLGGRDLLLLKLDSAGTVIWSRTAGSPACFPEDGELALAIAADPQGDRFAITGRHNCGLISFGSCSAVGTGSENPDNGFIAAYDTAGNCLWAQSATGFDVRPANVLWDVGHNAFWFGGVVTMDALFHGTSSIAVPPGGFVAKYSDTGELLSAERLLTNGAIHNACWYSPEEWVLCGEGTTGALLGGQSIGIGDSFYDGWVARVDTSGEVVWAVPVLSDSNAFVYRCALGPNGDIEVLGGFQGYAVVGSDTIHGSGYAWGNFLASYSSTGQVNWAHRLGDNEFVLVYDMEISPSGDIYVFGSFKNELTLPGMSALSASTGQDMFLARFDPENGQCKAAYHYGRLGSFYGAGYGSIWPTANGVYVAGDNDSTFTMGSYVAERSGPVATDLFIAKFDSLSGFTGISSMPLQNGNLHIYANPNKGMCTIDLPHQLRFTADLSLSVFDNTGHLVQRIPLRYTNDGVALDIRAQAKGIYHVELGDGSQRYSGTIVFE